MLTFSASAFAFFTIQGGHNTDLKLYAVVVVKHDFAPVDRADLLGTMDVAATSMKRAFDRSVHNAGFVFAVIKISRSCELSR